MSSSQPHNVTSISQHQRLYGPLTGGQQNGDSERIEERRRQLAQDVQALERLLQSRSWAVIKETMEREIMEASLGIANAAIMSKDEIDFRRGSIWAAHKLLQLPDTLIAQLRNEMLLLPIEDHSHDPAKAGFKPE